MRYTLDNNKILALVLSSISGAIELSAILFGLSLRLPLLEIVGLGLAYQIGNLVPNPLRLSKTAILFAATLALTCFCIYLFMVSEYLILFFGYIFIAVSLQSLRSFSKESVSLAKKRFFRVLGFISTPLVLWKMYFFVLAPILLLILAFLLIPKTENRIYFFKPKLRFINWIMIIHQIHYFSYVYFVCVIIYSLIKHSLFLMAIIFALGWITYISISLFIKGNRYVLYFVVGHIFLSIMLVMLALNLDNNLSILLWIATGLGGGTVVYLEKINNVFHLSDKGTFNFSENIGHVLGVASGLVVFAISYNIKLVFMLSFISAFIAAMFVWIYSGHYLVNNKNGL